MRLKIWEGDISGQIHSTSTAYPACLAAAAGIFFLSGIEVWAQVSGPPQPRLHDILPPLPGLDETSGVRGTFQTPAVKPAPATTRSSDPLLLLSSVHFEGNTVFSDAELESVASSFIGQPAGVDDLEALRLAITRRYVDAGYVNSGAVLPDQTITDGMVLYQIVEGRLDEIVVGETDRMNPDHVADRLNLAAGPPLNVNRLQRRLRILLDDPLIHRLDAELSPGLRLGESRLTVAVEEEPLLGLVAGVDNALQPSVGGTQGGGTAFLRNATGLGEIVTVSPTMARGFIEVEGTLSVPVTPFDTRVGLRGLFSRSEIIEEPFDALDIESESQEFGISIAQPIYRSPGRALTASLGFDHRKNETFLLDQPFSFSPGAEDGESVVSVFRGAAEWVDRSQDQVIAARAVASLGVDFLDSTVHSESRPDSEFLSFLGQGQWVRRFTPSEVEVAVRAEGQWTDDRLLPLEKFSAGGLGSVRGYRQDLQVGDRGWSATVEVRASILDMPAVTESAGDGGTLKVIPFIDAGSAWDIDDDSDPLLSVGVGLSWDITPDVVGAVYAGRGLMHRPDPSDHSIQDIGIHFSLSANLY